MAGENTLFVALVDRCRRFEVKSIQFFDAFDSLIVLTICSRAYISRSGDICADIDDNDDDDDDKTDKPIALPLADACRVIMYLLTTFTYPY